MPDIISPTIQEFKGERFYLCGRYFQHNGKRLHVAVWENAFGPVPHRYDVHHGDEDRANNELDNLWCVSKSEHHKLHIEVYRANIRKAHPLGIAAAPAWHRSSEGLEWHKLHWERDCKEALYRKMLLACDHCGKDFLGIGGKDKFCTNACKSAWRRASGLDDEARVCEICGESFQANKYGKQRTCSRVCGSELSAVHRRGKHHRKGLVLSDGT